MGRRKQTQWVEVEVEVACDEPHREDFHGIVQEVFNQVGPTPDRYTDWTRCQHEPWSSLSQVLTE